MSNTSTFLLKNVYSPAFYHDFCDALAQVIPGFDRDQFLQLIFDEQWEARELKERMRHTTQVLHQFLEHDLAKAIPQIIELITIISRKVEKDQSFEYLFFPDYVETYGQDAPLDVVLNGLHEITKFTSAEFAVRPFIQRQPNETLARMLEWSEDAHHNVRRLASEGSRPRLPWGMALKSLQKDPSPTLPILENLKSDNSEYVRKSVANHLNDISKDHPQIALQKATAWMGHRPEMDRLVKHGLRTLLKQGNTKALQLFGYAATDDLEVVDFQLAHPKIVLGENQAFSFVLKNKSNNTLKVRLEYAVYFQKANGSLSKKVFKIGEKEYAPKSETKIEKKQHFKPITTRKYHPGRHEIAIIVNGVEGERKGFDVSYV